MKKHKWTDIYNFEEKIQFVVNVYHFEMRKDINSIKMQLDEALLASSCPYLLKANGLFLDFEKKLNLHALFEENIVFPMLNSLSCTGQDKQFKPLLQMLMGEHQEDRLIIQTIFDALAKSSNYKASSLLESLDKFSVKLLEHSKYEDDFIFEVHCESSVFR
ncbi:MAG: hemerythrin domain-containing protein [Bdellovibrionales bacterium]|nr:hemerythrin domain-containing protein [Bdellovibrionales bacterium]